MPWYKKMSRWNKGLVVDGKNRICLDDSFRHLLCVAPSGAGKTSNYIIPNLLTLSKPSLIVTDPSGEIYNSTHMNLKGKGYLIKCLDFRVGKIGLQYNPLHRAKSITEIQQIAEILIQAGGKSGFEENFWNNAATSFLSLMLRFLWSKNKTAPNLEQLFLLTNEFSYNRKNLDRSFAEILADEDFIQYKAFIAQEEKIIASILSTAKVALQKIIDPTIVHITQRDTLDFEILRRKKTVLFLIIPEHQIYYFAFLLNILYTQLFDYAMELPVYGKTYLPIFFFLDEAPALGHISNLPLIITTLRKRQASISLVIQEFSQLEAIYGKYNTQTIANNCANHIYFPALGIETCTRLEKILGRQKRIPLMSASQIRTMPSNRALFISSNQLPILLKFRPWYKKRKWRRQSKS